MLCVILATNTASAQTCKYGRDKDGAIPDLIIIDGTPYYYYSVERNKKIAKDLVKYDSLKKIADAKDIVIKKQDERNKEQKNHNDFLQKVHKQDQEILKVSLGKPKELKPWYERAEVGFVAGAVTMGLLFGYWKWADSKN